MKRSKNTRWINPMDHMTRGDMVLGILVVGAAFVLFPLMPRWALSGGTRVELRSGQSLVGAYSLSEDRVVEVKGPLGVTSVKIEKGRVRVQSSPCREGICMHSGNIGAEGGALVCVPNEVVVSVAGEDDNELDAVTR